MIYLNTDCSFSALLQIWLLRFSGCGVSTGHGKL